MYDLDGGVGHWLDHIGRESGRQMERTMLVLLLVFLLGCFLAWMYYMGSLDGNK